MEEATVKKIEKFLISRNSPEVLFLLHRTSQSGSNQILQGGFNTRIEKYGNLSSVATIHSKLGSEFAKLLEVTHAGSSRNVVLILPFHSLEAIRDRAGSQKINLGFNKTPEVLSAALGGQLPREWIVGVFNQENKEFTPNADFNPWHKPDLPHLDTVLEEFKRTTRATPRP